MDEVLINKAAIIDRCLRRIGEEYALCRDRLETDFTRQDAIVLNLLRAVEAAIDGAMHQVRVQALGVPQSSRHAFALLEEQGALGTELSLRLQAMVGFRNVAVHAYQQLSVPILRNILDHHLVDLETFARILLGWARRDPPAAGPG